MTWYPARVPSIGVRLTVEVTRYPHEEVGVDGYSEFEPGVDAKRVGIGVLWKGKQLQRIINSVSDWLKSQ